MGRGRKAFRKKGKLQTVMTKKIVLNPDCLDPAGVIPCKPDPKLLKIAEQLTPQQLADLITTN